MGRKISTKIPILRLPYSNEEIDFLKHGLEEILNSGFLTMDKKVFEFERLFSEFVGVKYAVAVNSGTSALEIPLRSFDVRNKSIIVPTNTFMATPLSVVHAGGRVTFVDVMKENLSIDPSDLINKISDNTVGVIPVHIGGIISPFWDEIMQICKENNLFVIEDAAHAHGASIENQMAGTLGDAAAFSFYPTKVFNTAEGGMITTNNKDIYKKSLVLREHGKTNHTINIHSELGYNWRFSELHALLGIQQMHKAESILNERRKQAILYDKLLSELKTINAVINFLVINYNSKVIGINITVPQSKNNDNVITGFVPCYPTGLNYSMELLTKFADDQSIWNNYENTVAFLKKKSVA